MDRFEAMRAFVQVVECLSFTRAARQLDLHKASVSEQVRQLEARLGTRLLERSTRAVAPTADGLRYYRHACEILQQLDAAEAELRNDTSAAAGHLRVDVPVAMGRLVFVPEVRAFLERHPRITLELGCTDRVVDLVREGVDCALRGGELPDSRLSARALGALRFVLCAAPRYIDERGLPETPAALARHERVGYLAASSGRLQPIRLRCDDETHDVDVPARFVTTDSGAVLSAGLDGLGLIHVAEFAAAHHLASGALVRVLPRWRCATLPLHLLTPTRRRRAARVQAFMDWAHALITRRLGDHIELH